MPTKIRTEAGVVISVVDDWGTTLSFSKPVRAIGLTDNETEKLRKALLTRGWTRRQLELFKIKITKG